MWTGSTTLARHTAKDYEFEILGILWLPVKSCRYGVKCVSNVPHFVPDKTRLFNILQGTWFAMVAVPGSFILWVSSLRCWHDCRLYQVSSSATRSVALTWRWTCLVCHRTLCVGNFVQKSYKTTPSTRSMTRSRLFSRGSVCHVVVITVSCS